MKKLYSLVAGLAIVIVAGGAWFATRLPSSPFDGQEQPIARMPVAVGEYAARLADCVACHSLPEGKPFAGGLQMGTPIGSVFATNITPDKETGIGNYSLADFDRAVRHGVTPDGRRLYPAMPYPSYAKLSDDDVKSLYDYFMNHVEPVHQSNRPSNIPWPLNMRWPLAFWSLVFAPTQPYHPDPSKDDLWNRGAYLVEGPGHCGSCHTPRGLAMQEKAMDSSKTSFVSGALLDGWFAPSLRNDPNTGLGRWSEKDIATFLKTGRNSHAVVFGSMAEAYNNSTQFMADGDLAAIAHYLKSLPGDPQRDGAPWQYRAPVAGAASVPGQQIYATRCGFCHGADGRGRDQWIPALAGATSLLAKEDASAINITLNGSGRIVTNGAADAYRMPPLRDQLTDKEISDVLTYVRSAWGNSGAPVKPEDVKAMRDHTDPASSQPIILQMR